ncbi:MAG: lasso peptide biosynthesis B2 protein [Gemmatimonadaceae bacterium]|nr:lasso peptide biosynthesis B2 protein [Gemmatimonadaceae bacterium]
MRRLRNFVALDAGARALAWRALLWTALLRVAVAVVRFARLRRWAEATTPRPGANYDARAVRRAVLRAQRLLPGTRCLVAALVAERLLRQGALPARVTIGVAKAGPTLDAHAWVESGDVTVCGDDVPRAHYRALATFDAGTR